MDFLYAQERINATSTKKYIKEAISCYNDGNYRSATNSLYAVVIVDIVEKLKTLAELYDNSKAQQILQEVETKIEKDGDKWSAWENDLIDEVKKTPMLSSPTLAQTIDELKQWRNFSSHPTISEFGASLKTPDRYIVAHFFQVIFDELFTVSPSLIGKVTSDFVDFLEEKKDIFSNDENKIRIYIEDSFLNKMNDEQKDSLLKDLFKFVFIKMDPHCRANRKLNLSALLVIIKKDPKRYIQLIVEDTDTLRRVDLDNGKQDKDSVLKCFEILLQNYNQISFNISEVQKSALQRDSQKSLGRYLLNSFAEEKLTTRLNKVNKRLENGNSEVEQDDEEYYLYKLISDHIIEKKDIEQLITKCKYENCLDEFGLMLVNLFSSSYSFIDAASIYGDFIKPILPELSEANLKKLLEVSNQNNQIYNSFDVDKRSIVDSYIQTVEKNNKSIDNIDEIKEEIQSSYPNLFL